jgi:hypothetical protein
MADIVGKGNDVLMGGFYACVWCLWWSPSVCSVARFQIDLLWIDGHCELRPVTVWRLHLLLEQPLMRANFGNSEGERGRTPRKKRGTALPKSRAGPTVVPTRNLFVPLRAVEVDMDTAAESPLSTSKNQEQRGRKATILNYYGKRAEVSGGDKNFHEMYSRI